MPAGQAICAAASARSVKTAASAPATTAIRVGVGRKPSGSASGVTSNQRAASARKVASEKPLTPCTRRWLAKIVSPGASSVKKAMSLCSRPG